MAILKALDLIIQDHCITYRPNGPDDMDTDVDDNKYDVLKAEINEHIQGTKKLHQLSKEAQDIMHEWEVEQNQMRGMSWTKSR
jgi:hypothetical protein